MKKNIYRFSVCLMAALLLAVVGCTTDKITTGKKSKTENDAAKIKAQTLILATTTSTKDSGLLDVIIPVFEKKFNAKVKIIAVGTGEALKMGEQGEADVLLVHARQSEDEFMAKGFGSIRKDVMYNDFVILGPKTDPAGIKQAADPVEAFKKIAASQAAFVTRGDDSGTYKKEMKIWASANIQPAGNWYISTGQGMGPSLTIANEKQAYILCDRAVYLAQQNKIELTLLLENAKGLLNPYGVIAVNPELWPKVNKQVALDFIDWITSVETQKNISEFGKDKFGQSLFIPDSERWKTQNSK